MSIPVELSIISEIIKNHDFRTPRAHGITSSMFITPEFREMYRFIESHYNSKKHYGSVPSERIMQQRFKTFSIADTIETLPELCEILRKMRMGEELYSRLTQSVDALDNNEEPDNVLSDIKDISSRMSRYVPGVHERDIKQTGQEFLEWYESRKAIDSVLGIPWPWERLTEATQGIDSQDLVIIFGRPKSMKSFIAIKSITDPFHKHNIRALAYSCEMDEVRFERRVYSAIAEVDYKLMKEGRLCPADEDTLRSVINDISTGEISNSRSSIKIVPMGDCPGGMKPIDHLAVCIENFQPDLVLVDSFYRMEVTRRWEKQAELVTKLKDLTQTYNVPIIGVTQATRSKGGGGDSSSDNNEDFLEDVAFADAVGQESDLVIRVKKQGRYPDGSRLIRLSVAGTRESEEEGGSLFIRLKPYVSSVADKWVGAGEETTETTPEEPKKPKEPSGKKLPKSIQKQVESKRWSKGDIEIGSDLGLFGDEES